MGKWGPPHRQEPTPSAVAQNQGRGEDSGSLKEGAAGAVRDASWRRGHLRWALLSAQSFSSHGACSLGVSLFGYPFLGLFLAALSVGLCWNLWLCPVCGPGVMGCSPRGCFYWKRFTSQLFLRTRTRHSSRGLGHCPIGPSISRVISLCPLLQIILEGKQKQSSG